MPFGAKSSNVLSAFETLVPPNAKSYVVRFRGYFFDELTHGFRAGDFPLSAITVEVSELVFG